MTTNPRVRRKGFSGRTTIKRTFLCGFPNYSWPIQDNFILIETFLYLPYSIRFLNHTSRSKSFQILWEEGYSFIPGWFKNRLKILFFFFRQINFILYIIPLGYYYYYSISQLVENVDVYTIPHWKIVYGVGKPIDYVLSALLFCN